MSGLDLAGAAITRAEIASRAKANAQRWKENCWVYEHKSYWLMSRGPDLDHPKTEPAFVIEYVKEVKHERL